MDYYCTAKNTLDRKIYLLRITPYTLFVIAFTEFLSDTLLLSFLYFKLFFYSILSLPLHLSYTFCLPSPPPLPLPPSSAHLHCMIARSDWVSVRFICLQNYLCADFTENNSLSPQTAHPPSFSSTSGCCCCRESWGSWGTREAGGGSAGSCWEWDCWRIS